MVSFSKSSKAGNINQTRQLCKCNSRFETRILSRFVDFRQYANAFKLLGTPFQTNVEEVEEKYQLEWVDLQCDEFLKARLWFCVHCWILPKVRCTTQEISKPFSKCQNNNFVVGSTYCCEQLFSKMEYTKSYLRSSLRDDLEDILLLSTTNIPADVKTLSKPKYT